MITRIATLALSLVIVSFATACGSSDSSVPADFDSWNSLSPEQSESEAPAPGGDEPTDPCPNGGFWGDATESDSVCPNGGFWGDGTDPNAP